MRLADASKLRFLSLVSALAAGVSLSACAGGGVEFSGPGFTIGGDKVVADKKVPDRAPLVLPPDKTRLPEPQQPVVASANQENWPNDPDAQRKSEEQEATEKKKEYEDKGDWSKNAGIDEFEKLSKPGQRKEGGLLNRWYKSQNSDESATSQSDQ